MSYRDPVQTVKCTLLAVVVGPEDTKVKVKHPQLTRRKPPLEEKIKYFYNVVVVVSNQEMLNVWLLDVHLSRGKVFLQTG
jgi:hypothetical protein